MTIQQLQPDSSNLQLQTLETSNILPVSKRARLQLDRQQENVDKENSSSPMETLVNFDSPVIEDLDFFMYDKWDCYGPIAHFDNYFSDSIPNTDVINLEEMQESMSVINVDAADFLELCERICKQYHRI